MKKIGQNSASRQYHLLRMLVLLTAGFLMWQMLCFIYSFQINFMLIISMPNAAQTSWIIWRAISYYFFVQFGLYGLFVFVIWGITRITAVYLKLSETMSYHLGIVIWFLGVLIIVLANQFLFPLSLFAKLSQFILSEPISLHLFFISLSLFVLILLFVALQLMIWIRARYQIWQIVSVISVVGITVCLYTFYQSVPAKMLHTTKPNVIIIGLDALRPDRVGDYGHQPSITPQLDRFLKKSTNFRASMTPLARTFPSWSSLLTGQYPKHSDIRFNLINQKHLHLQNTLAAILKRQGYQTIYATDDRRFSNISKKFGFDALWGIQAGANDFLLGTINDFPLSNLFVNSNWGRFLFPYSYANRAAAINYEPKTFLHLLSRKLKALNSNEPVLLCVHFCLPHWPYTWAKSSGIDSLSDFQRYQQTIVTADQQFGAFIQILKRDHFLKNALVFVISDHGDAFLLSSDRIIHRKRYVAGPLSRHDIFQLLSPSSDKNMAFGVSIGHGTDVLSYSQIHNILAFRAFGPETNAAYNVWAPVSMIDIKPTVLSMLKLPSPQSDGISLVPYIQHLPVKDAQRMFFEETGLAPSAVKAKQISIQNAIYEARDMFKVDQKTGRLVMKSSMVKKLLQVKQRAVYYGPWVLALYPGPHAQFVPVLVNRQTGLWTDDLTIPFAEHSPAIKMLRQLKHFYGSEVANIY